MQNKAENLHQGHFRRLREQVDKSGFEALNDHQKLELLLSFLSVRKDVNPLAHELLNTFGSFYNIVNARKFALMKVKGVSERVASFLTLLPEYFYEFSKSKAEIDTVLSNEQDILSYFSKSISELGQEKLLVIALTTGDRYIGCKVIKGSETSIEMDISEILTYLIGVKASKLVLVHNHPSGDSSPSIADIITTGKICVATASLNIVLQEHLIVSKEEYFSFRKSELIDIIKAVNMHEVNNVSKYISATSAKLEIMSRIDNLKDKKLSNSNAALIATCQYYYNRKKMMENMFIGNHIKTSSHGSDIIDILRK